MKTPAKGTTRSTLRMRADFHDLICELAHGLRWSMNKAMNVLMAEGYRALLKRKRIAQGYRDKRGRHFRRPDVKTSIGVAPPS
jgi:hypothetical protein